MTLWRMRIACWVPKATNTHTGCVILIALPLQQWLHERASVLCYTYISCIVYEYSSKKKNLFPAVVRISASFYANCPTVMWSDQIISGPNLFHYNNTYLLLFHP